MPAAGTWLIFDVNETVLNLHPVQEIVNKVTGNPLGFDLFFTKLLTTSHVYAMTGLGSDFTVMQKASLFAVCEAFGKTATDADFDAIKTAMASMPAHEEVPAALDELKKRGWKLCAFSNSTLESLTKGLTGAGIVDKFDSILSVQGNRHCKPYHSTYQYALGGAPLPLPCTPPPHPHPAWAARPDPWCTRAHPPTSQSLAPSRPTASWSLATTGTWRAAWRSASAPRGSSARARLSSRRRTRRRTPRPTSAASSSAHSPTRSMASERCPPRRSARALPRLRGPKRTTPLPQTSMRIRHRTHRGRGLRIARACVSNNLSSFEARRRPNITQ